MAWKVAANISISCLAWGGEQNIWSNLSYHSFRQVIFYLEMLISHSQRSNYLMATQNLTR